MSDGLIIALLAVAAVVVDVAMPWQIGVEEGSRYGRSKVVFVVLVAVLVVLAFGGE